MSVIAGQGQPNRYSEMSDDELKLISDALRFYEINKSFDPVERKAIWNTISVLIAKVDAELSRRGV